MAQSYGQYCPLALAVELLCQRWTLLVLSRLLDGCTRFNEIHRGVPRMSPSLLSQRLAELEKAGLVRSRRRSDGPGKEYAVTEAARELDPVVDHLAVWGHRWARDMVDDDLDPAFLVWSMHLRLDTETMPAGRTVIEFKFSGAPTDCRQFWLINRDGEVEMCLKDPELEVDLLVTAPLRTFVEAWRGFRDMREEIAAGRIKLFGSTDHCSRFPDWLQLSMLAPYPRKREGRERKLARGAGRLQAGSASGR